jgi:cytoskeletal protein CcmA (bactofilin family)
MSSPDTQTDFTVDEILLHQPVGKEAANLSSDPSSHFENWLSTLKPNQVPDAEVAGPADPTAIDYRPEQPREIKFEGTLSVDGYLAGRVSSAAGTLIATAGGEIDADVSVNVAIICGKVRGDIKAATRVELGSTARVIGDIETPSLSLHPGAVFEGRCTFLPDPQETESSEPVDAELVS